MDHLHGIKFDHGMCFEKMARGTQADKVPSCGARLFSQLRPEVHIFIFNGKP